VWVRNEHIARWEFAAGYATQRVVVDCATGAGGGADLFGRAGADHVYAFDASPDAVSTARARTGSNGCVTVREGSALSLPMQDASADLYVSLETIEHLEDDRAFLIEVRRVLRPGGVFICSTPNRAVTMPGKDAGEKPWNPFHVREYTREEFVNLLSADFEVTHVLGQNLRTKGRVGVMAAVGRVLPGHLAARFNSIVKLPRIAFDRVSQHRVREIPSNRDAEYLVAVCTRR
jgi:ubiquinone/menaquinone biosynthesis C-methylase UbiE